MYVISPIIAILALASSGFEVTAVVFLAFIYAATLDLKDS